MSEHIEQSLSKYIDVKTEHGSMVAADQEMAHTQIAMLLEEVSTKQAELSMRQSEVSLLRANNVQLKEDLARAKEDLKAVEEVADKLRHEASEPGQRAGLLKLLRERAMRR